jgi:micrococcal nuclease
MSKEKLLLLIILIILILVINKTGFTNLIQANFPDTRILTPTQPANKQTANTELQNSSFTAVVVHIADGDTVHIKLPDGSKEVVRFLAVNTLEMTSTSTREVCFAKLAKDFTTKELLNKEITFTPDPTQPKRDKYGRLLLYLQVVGDNQTFNEKLMQTGLARTYKASPPAREWQKYENIRLEKEVQKEGIWNPNLCTGFTP